MNVESDITKEKLEPTNDETQKDETVLMIEDEDDVQVDRSGVERMAIDEDLLRQSDDSQQNLTYSTSEQHRLSSSLNRFDPIVLLRRSVQAAAGRLEDDPVMAKRATERIDLILNLLPEDSSKMQG
jgi:hypothetical protein